jgi:hypothetical protein
MVVPVAHGRDRTLEIREIRPGGTAKTQFAQWLARRYTLL